jgi:hypothetical protein
VTHRRWQGDEDSVGDLLGPVEQAVSDELEHLGYTPLTPPGALRTAAVRALSLAEVIDHSMNSSALPGMDRQLGNVMAEARQAVDRASGGLEDPASADPEEVDDFTRRRQQREGGGDEPPAATN